MSLPYTLRPFNPDTDFPRQVEIANAFDPLKWTVEAAQEFYPKKPAGLIERDMVAVDGEGYIVATGSVSCLPWMVPEKHFRIEIAVDPAFHHRGIGTVFYDDLYAFAAQRGLLRLDASCNEDLPDSIAFAQKRGFVIDRQMYDSILNVASFDEVPFSGVIDSVQRSGVCFITYADVEDTLENQRKLYELDAHAAHDIPGYDQPAMPFEEWLRGYFINSFVSAERIFLAVDGDRWVGYARLGFLKDDNILGNWGTGVDRVYRGRKMALAIKLLTIKYAKQNGVAWMRTNNDSLNAPMLAINRKLGYSPVSGKYTMKKELAQ